VVFGIFTLALIPLLAQELTGDDDSIYAVPIPFKLFRQSSQLYLTQVCRPQHLSFIAGIVLFCAGTTKGIPPVLIVAGLGTVLAVALFSTPGKKWYIGPFPNPHGRQPRTTNSRRNSSRSISGNRGSGTTSCLRCPTWPGALVAPRRRRH